MGFEPTRAEHNGLAVHRLNHSATSSACTLDARFCFRCLHLQPTRAMLEPMYRVA